MFLVIVALLAAEFTWAFLKFNEVVRYYLEWSRQELRANPLGIVEVEEVEIQAPGEEVEVTQK